jgi:hypothetical protein
MHNADRKSGPAGAHAERLTDAERVIVRQHLAAGDAAVRALYSHVARSPLPPEQSPVMQTAQNVGIGALRGFAEVSNDALVAQANAPTLRPHMPELATFELGNDPATPAPYIDAVLADKTASATTTPAEQPIDGEDPQMAAIRAQVDAAFAERQELADAA